MHLKHDQLFLQLFTGKIQNSFFEHVMQLCTHGNACAQLCSNAKINCSAGTYHALYTMVRHILVIIPVLHYAPQTVKPYPFVSLCILSTALGGTACWRKEH